MDVKKLDELAKLIDLCRKKGVLNVEMEGLKLQLDQASLYPESPYKRRKRTSEDSSLPMEEMKFTEADSLFWSSTGILGEETPQ